MRLVISILVLLTFPVIAHGKTGADCAKIYNDNKRLLCYDLLFKTTFESPKVDGVGKWQVTDEVSKIDDSKNVFAILDSTDKFPSRYGNMKNVRLTLRCFENTTSAVFRFPKTFVSDNSGYGDVTIRLDKNKAFNKSLTESTNNRALGLWRGGKSIPFIRSLFGNTSMLLRFTPYNESSSTVTFNIAGIENAIKPVAKACGWKM